MRKFLNFFYIIRILISFFLSGILISCSTGANNRVLTSQASESGMLSNSESPVFIYVPNNISHSISMYKIQESNGQLTPLSPATVATEWAPGPVIIDPTDRFTYVNNQANSVDMYTINKKSGLLSSLSTTGAPSAPNNGVLFIDPSGKYAYLANYGSYTISMYSKDPETGILHPLLPVTVATESGPYSVSLSTCGSQKNCIKE